MNNKLQNISHALEVAHNVKIADKIAFYLCEEDQDFFHFCDADENTIFDLASLTKIIGTTLALAMALSENRLSLDDKKFSCWPNTTIRALLKHTSGLSAHELFYLDSRIGSNFAKNKQIILENLFNHSINPEFIGRRVYSDLGFMALGWILEKIYKQDLYTIFRRAFKKLELSQNFFYFPSQKQFFHQKTKEIAATGICPLRHSRIVGQVNDLKCFFMGGIAGHAGLFGTINDVKNYALKINQCMSAPNNSFEKTIQYFTQNHLGFDFVKKDGSTKKLSQNSVGHFGYTGTSLWIDKGLSMKKSHISILLTNRLNQNKSGEGIFWLRSKVHF